MKEIKEAIEVLQRHQFWRKGADVDPVDPTKLGVAIDLILCELRTYPSCKIPIVHNIDINGICKDCGKDIKK